MNESMAILAPTVTSPLVLKAFGDDLIVAGYASVEMVDKQGDLITRGALKEAFGGFMKAEGFRNVQLAHSNIQVGTVIPSYTDSNGRVWKSEVDDTGMFVVIQLRGDIEKAREVASEIRKGNLRSFSIGGQAFERVNKSDATRGDYREIRRMELHEVTICEKGINPEAQFRILKEDTGDTMTDPMSELQSVLERLSKKLDDEDDKDDKKKDKEDKDKGFPFESGDDDGGDEKPLLDGPSSKKKPKLDLGLGDDSPLGDDDEEDDEEEDLMYGDDMTEKADEMITMDYLNWLERTAKSGGHDIADARAHFDSVNKGYGPGQSGWDHRGQGSLEGAGEDDSGKRPKQNFGSAPSGNKNVIKADFIMPTTVSQSDIEAAYDVYKAASVEQQFKGSLGEYFADRLSAEQTIAKNETARTKFDSRKPLLELQKAVVALDDRISRVSTSGGETLIKSGSSTSVTIPDTTEMADMSWDDVHRLAAKALRGE